MADDPQKTPADPSTATSQGAGKSDAGDTPTEGKTAQDGGSATSQGAGKEGDKG